MIVLGLDTATPATAVGLKLADGSILEARDDPPVGQRPGHSTRLLVLAEELLCEAKIGWSEIERIAVGVGPGTFTGLRIGIATARGLAQSSGAQLVGVSSLRALARAMLTSAESMVSEDRFLRRRQEHDGAVASRVPGVEDGTGVLAAIDARRGEVFVSAYDRELEVLAPEALPPKDLDRLLERVVASTGLQRWVAVGDGALLHREAFGRLGVLVPDNGSAHRIQGQAICALGEEVLGEQVPGEEGSVVPDYLRRPDAEIALEGAP